MSEWNQQDFFETEASISSPAPTLVSRFPLQARKGAKKIKDTSGPKFLDSLKTTGFVHITFLEKTLVDILESVLTPYQRTWSVVVTDGGVSVLKQRVSGQITDGKESGGSQKMWLTPNVMDSIEPRNPEALKRQYDKNRKGRKTHSTLREQIVYPEPKKLWPTPQASDHLANQSETLEAWEKRAKKKKEQGINLQFALRHSVQMWPTPLGRDYKGGRKLEALKKAGRNPSNSLPDAVTMWPTPTAGLEKHSTKDAYWENRIKKGRQRDIQMEVCKQEGTGSLNPTWVEWLMGFPIGYTDLKHLETQ